MTYYVKGTDLIRETVPLTKMGMSAESLHKERKILLTWVMSALASECLLSDGLPVGVKTFNRYSSASFRRA